MPMSVGWATSGLHYSNAWRSRAGLKVFLQSGARDFDNSHGSWPLANQQLAQSLDFAGYDFKFEFGEGGHNLAHGGAIFPDTLRWLWSGYIHGGDDGGSDSGSDGTRARRVPGGNAFGWRQPASSATAPATTSASA